MKKTALQFLIFVFWGSLITAQNTIYVSKTATGLNDGSSWSNAYVGITLAVDAAWSGDTILVKAGEYKEMLTIDKSLHIYGGFSGVENYSTEANPKLNEVVLNADVNGDDVQGSMAERLDNYNYLIGVVGISEATIHLSGLTLMNGFNDGGFNSSRGGALIIQSGSAGTPSSPKAVQVYVQKCKFYQNYCNSEGGAIYTGSTVIGNQVQTYIDQCEFIGNGSIGARGGAIFNYAFGGSGAVASLFVSNSIFQNNVDLMTDFPAVIYNGSSSFAGNAYAHVLNNTFVNNSGGAVFNYHGGTGTNTVASLLFKNNIIDNVVTGYAPLYIGNAGTSNHFYQVLIDHNCFMGTVQNNVNAGVVITNTLANNPTFVGTNDFRLQETSPCVNAGDTANISLIYLDTLDFQDSSRFQGVVDLGAYEYQPMAEEPIDTSNTSAVISLKDGSRVEFYPNPAQNQIQVNLNHIGEVCIYDLQGHLLLTSTPRKNHVIQIEQLASGMYIMKTVDSTMRFMKTH